MMGVWKDVVDTTKLWATLVLLMLLMDTMLYQLMPFDNIHLVSPDSGVCRPSVSPFGCAFRGSGIGYAMYPSLNIAAHENVHAIGYGEAMATTMSIIIFVLYLQVALPLACWLNGYDILHLSGEKDE